MKLSGFASFLLVCVVGFVCAQEQWPLHNDGINSVVEWYVFSARKLASCLIVLQGTITAISSMDSVFTFGLGRLVNDFLEQDQIDQRW
jgi:hypothetical protein